MNWLAFSSQALLIAFVMYCLAFISFVIAIAGSRFNNREPEKHRKRWGNFAFFLIVVGFAAQVVYFFARWAGGGHVPTSNMFEFMTFLGMMIMAAFIVIYLFYRAPLLGVFAAPVGIIILAYAAVFPKEVQPLIPALQSYWLYIHVTTAALGEAFFAVGFAAGLMYLLCTVNYRDSGKIARRERFWLEMSLFVILIVVGFIADIFGFRAAGYEAEFVQQVVTVDQNGQPQTVEQKVEYTLPALVKPYNSEKTHMDAFLGMNDALFAAPGWMKGVNAGRKLNTILWAIITGALLYALLRLVLRKPVGASFGGIMNGIDPDDLDEICYRAIAIGFPIYTLGALVFAMIWAQEAWGRFWGFDPKETWALITWLFYTLFLHLRLSRGWQGKKSSWLAVIGFIVVMFTLIGVNLIIAGLHSYAGV
ncbi:MAG TPA: cytochrome c biogenesis protein CcsA [Bacilli bacterium]